MRTLTGQGRTTVQVALDGTAAGIIAIADSPRDTAKASVTALRELGVRAVMLTGDSQATAERVAAQVGILDVIAEVSASGQGSQSQRGPGPRPQRGDARRRRQ